jgi:hypothetical protein
MLVDLTGAGHKTIAILLEAAGHVVTAFDDGCVALGKISTHTERFMPLIPNDCP